MSLRDTYMADEVWREGGYKLGWRLRFERDAGQLTRQLHQLSVEELTEGLLEAMTHVMQGEGDTYYINVRWSLWVEAFKYHLGQLR